MWIVWWTALRSDRLQERLERYWLPEYKIENPDSLRKIVNPLPFCLRRRWRDVADNITEKEEREITIEDVAKTAINAAHPILFGSLAGDSKDEKLGNGQSRPRRKFGDYSRYNFAINSDRNGQINPLLFTFKYPIYDVNHWLSHAVSSVQENVLIW